MYCTSAHLLSLCTASLARCSFVLCCTSPLSSLQSSDHSHDISALLFFTSEWRRGVDPGGHVRSAKYLVSCPFSCIEHKEVPFRLHPQPTRLLLLPAAPPLSPPGRPLLCSAPPPPPSSPCCRSPPPRRVALFSVNPRNPPSPLYPSFVSLWPLPIHRGEGRAPARGAGPLPADSSTSPLPPPASPHPPRIPRIPAAFTPPRGNVGTPFLPMPPSSPCRASPLPSQPPPRLHLPLPAVFSPSPLLAPP
jgi:hypothetical protein